MVLTAAEMAEFQTYVALAMVHKYTRSAVVEGTVDTWKMANPTYPSTVSDVPCNYLSEGSLITRDKGVTQLENPTLMVAASDPIKIGDRVTNIKTSDNFVVHLGPLYVTDVATAMGFGQLTNKIVSLHSQAPKKW